MISRGESAALAKDNSDDEFFCCGHSGAAATNVQQEVDSYSKVSNGDNGTLETLKN